MKRLLLVLALSLTLLCGCAEAPSDVEEDDFLLVGDLSTPDEPLIHTASSFALPIYSGQTLDPITCSEGIQRSVSALLYEGLFTLSPSFEVEYCLCDSYEYDPATFVYTFHLRQGVTFGDGSALSARDVIATLQRAQLSERYAARFAAVSSMRAVGTDSVRIAMTRDDATLPALLDIPIVRSGTEKDLIPLGTGPYLYITEGAQDYLRANSAWWQGEIQPLVRIELSPVRDEDTAAYRFSAGEVQLLRSNLLGISGVSSTTGISVTSVDTTELLFLGFNSATVSDANLRYTLSLGIDRESFVSGYLSGYAKSAWAPISPASPLYPKDLERDYQRKDFEAALDALGYGAEGEATARTLTLLVNEESSEKVSIASSIAAGLSHGKLQVSVKALPWDRYTAALQSGSFDLYLGEVRLTPNWDLSPLVGSLGSMNYGYFSDVTLDVLMQSFRSDATTASARQLCAFLARQCPLIPLCFRTDTVLTHTAVLSELTPTAASPFYGLQHWEVTLIN